MPRTGRPSASSEDQEQELSLLVAFAGGLKRQGCVNAEFVEAPLWTRREHREHVAAGAVSQTTDAPAPTQRHWWLAVQLRANPVLKRVRRSTAEAYNS